MFPARAVYRERSPLSIALTRRSLAYRQGPSYAASPSRRPGPCRGRDPVQAGEPRAARSTPERRAEPRRDRHRRLRRLRRRLRPGRTRLPAGARAARSTASSGRRPTGRWTRPAGASATGCSATASATRSSATTSPSCSTGCWSWASTPAAPTASSDRAPSSRVREFQRNVGLGADGTCGPATLKALDPAAPHRRRRPGPVDPRDRSSCAAPGPTLAGKSIVIDPGHGGVDRGAQHHGLDEAWLAEDLAARIEGRLTAVGVQAYLTRSADLAPGGGTIERRRAGRARQRHRRRPVPLAARRRLDQPAGQRGRGVLLRLVRRRRASHRLGDRRAARRAAAATRSSAAPTCSTAAPTPRPGSCCG